MEEISLIIYWRTIVYLMVLWGNGKTEAKGFRRWHFSLQFFKYLDTLTCSTKKIFLCSLLWAGPDTENCITEYEWLEEKSEIAQPLLPREWLFITSVGKSHLQNPEEKIETWEVAELKSQKCLSVTLQTVSVVDH